MNDWLMTIGCIIISFTIYFLFRSYFLSMKDRKVEKEDNSTMNELKEEKEVQCFVCRKAFVTNFDWKNNHALCSEECGHIYVKSGFNLEIENGMFDK